MDGISSDAIAATMQRITQTLHTLHRTPEDLDPSLRDDHFHLDDSLSPMPSTHSRVARELTSSNLQIHNVLVEKNDKENNARTRRVVSPGPSPRLCDTKARERKLEEMARKEEQRQKTTCTFKPETNVQTTQFKAYVPLPNRVSNILQERTHTREFHSQLNQMKLMKEVTSKPEITAKARATTPTQFSRWESERKAKIEMAREKAQTVPQNLSPVVSRHSREVLAKSQRHHLDVISHASMVAASRAAAAIKQHSSPPPPSAFTHPHNTTNNSGGGVGDGPCTLEWWHSMVSSDDEYWMNKVTKLHMEQHPECTSCALHDSMEV